MILESISSFKLHVGCLICVTVCVCVCVHLHKLFILPELIFYQCTLTLTFFVSFLNYIFFLLKIYLVYFI